MHHTGQKPIYYNKLRIRIKLQGGKKKLGQLKVFNDYNKKKVPK